MKVLAINGSPHLRGNTYHAINTVKEELEKEGIEVEIINVGKKPFAGCMGCGACRVNTGRCAFGDADGLNAVIEKVREADGVLLASPVHFAGVSGAMKCFCDRLFYVSGRDAGLLRHKVGAALVAVRRSGGSSALDCLNHYLTYKEMIVVSSNYWNIIHGTAPGEIYKDEEGMQIMRLLAKNMAWALEMREKGIASAPAYEEKTLTNFIR